MRLRNVYLHLFNQTTREEARLLLVYHAGRVYATYLMSRKYRVKLRYGPSVRRRFLKALRHVTITIKE